MTPTQQAGGHPGGSPHRIAKRGWIAAAAGAAVLLALAVALAVGRAGRPAALSYGAFLDQVDVGNVVAVTFQGTMIEGRLRHSPAAAGAQGAASAKDFTSRVPDFGDPSLIPLLRRHGVAIDVAAPSSWTWLLERVPWPMLLFVVALVVAAFVRLVRGSHDRSGIGLGSGGPMAGLLASLATRRHGAEAESRQERGDGE